MSKYKVGDLIQHIPEYEDTEPQLYLVTKVTKKEYELTTTTEPFESILIDNDIDTWNSVKLI